MRRLSAVTTVLALLCVCAIAQAAITIDTVVVGDKGNTPDQLTGYGSVSYDYNIGKYEVTAGQYTAFLNAKAKTDTYRLYNSSMWTNTHGCQIQQSGSSGSYIYTVASDYANRPVNDVSYWDALRFANWLGNGQGDGDTETGAYTLNGYNGTDGRTIQRNAGWTWAVTTEAEWYKSAYYKGSGTGTGYWLYPTCSNTLPGRDMADASGNNANYYSSGFLIGSPYYRTEVGEFQNSASAYGTFDQGGNVWEWTEAVVHDAYRGLRGGSYIYTDRNCLKSSYPYYDFGYPSNEYVGIGFRVVQAVPAPSSVITLAGGLVSLHGLRRRREQRRNS